MRVEQTGGPIGGMAMDNPRDPVICGLCMLIEIWDVFADLEVGYCLNVTYTDTRQILSKCMTGQVRLDALTDYLAPKGCLSRRSTRAEMFKKGRVKKKVADGADFLFGWGER
jgi:hypothetical protein